MMALLLGTLVACRVPPHAAREAPPLLAPKPPETTPPETGIPGEVVPETGLAPGPPGLPLPPEAPLDVLADTEALELYLGAGGDPNARVEGVPLLHGAIEAAARGDRLPETRQAWVGGTVRLLEAGARLDLTDTEGRTPLALAAELGVAGAVRELLARGAFPDDPPAEPGVEQPTPLLRAVSAPTETKRQETVVRLLLEAGANPNRRDHNRETPLHHAAARCGRLGVVRALHRHGAEVNAGDVQFFTPLRRANAAGCPGIRTYLLSAGGRELSQPYPVGNGGDAARAVLNHDLRLLATLPVSALTVQDARNELGQVVTSLHLAAEHGRPETLAVLAQRGVDWSVRDPYGRTPLHMAVLREDAATAGFLLAYGANPLAVDIAGQTPLSLATGLDPEIARMLLQRVEVPPRLDDLPQPLRVALRNAVLAGHTSLVRRLVTPGTVDETLFRLAVQAGRPELATVLATDPADPEVQLELARSAANHAAAENYKAGKAPAPPRLQKGWNIWGKTGLLRYPLEMWAPYLTRPPERNLAKLPVGLYVPGNYRQGRGFGLLVFIHGGLPMGDHPPEAYRDILDRNRMIWAGYGAYNGLEAERPSSEGNGAPDVSEQEAFALSVVHNLRQYFDLDPRRIYLAGFGQGARVAGDILPRSPRVFRGGLLMGGQCLEGAPWFPARRMAQAGTGLVLSAGDLDAERAAVFRSAQRCLAEGFRKVFLLQDAGAGRAPLSPAGLHKALRLLDP